MLSVAIVGSVSAFTSDIDDYIIDDDYDDSTVPDGSYDLSDLENPLIWTGAGDDNLASNPENWNEGIVPYNGADVVFDSTSVKDCIWDIDASVVTVNSLTLATGYTGTLTQGNVDIGIGKGGIYTSSGTSFVPRPYYYGTSCYVICDGDAQFLGDLSDNALNIIMTGEGSILRYPFSIRSLTLRANVSLPYGANQIIGSLNIPSGLTLTIGDGRSLQLYYAAVQNSKIYGHIVGTESSSLIFRSFDSREICDLSSATINVPVIIYGMRDLQPDTIFKLSSNVNLGSFLTVYSIDTTNKLTIDLNGHTLTADSITVGTRAAIVGDGTIINHGDLDASVGTINLNGHYVQAGSGTMNMYDGSYLDRLTVLPKASLHLGSDLYLGRLPTHHYNIFSPDGYGYWIDETFYTVPIWESVSDDEKPYIAIIFLVLVLVISIIGYHYRIVLLQLVSLLCLAYGISRYISHPVVEWYPIYLILTLAGIVMIIYSIIRR